jgi:hypothetical protein
MRKERNLLIDISLLGALFALDIFCLAIFEKPIIYGMQIFYVSVLWLEGVLPVQLMSALLTLAQSSIYRPVSLVELLSMTVTAAIVFGLKKVLQPSTFIRYTITCLLVLGHIQVVDYLWYLGSIKDFWTFFKIIANMIIIYGVIRCIAR